VWDLFLSWRGLGRLNVDGWVAGEVCEWISGYRSDQPPPRRIEGFPGPERGGVFGDLAGAGIGAALGGKVEQMLTNGRNGGGGGGPQGMAGGRRWSETVENVASPPARNCAGANVFGKLSVFSICARVSANGWVSLCVYVCERMCLRARVYVAVCTSVCKKCLVK